MKDWNGRHREHLVAARLVVRLELLKIMYRVLMKRGVGTNIIECEHIRMIKERVSGPTGHRLIEDGPGEDQEEMRELGTEQEKLKCWRDPSLVRRLTGVRVKVLAKQLKKAKEVFKKEMKFVEMTKSNPEVMKAWEEVKEIRKEIWAEESPRINRKIDHLTRKANQCMKHKTCKELRAIWDKKVKDRVKVQEEEKCDILENTEARKTNEGDSVVDTSPTGRLLGPRYYSRPEDLKRLDKEQEELSRLSKMFNKTWKKPETGGDNEDTEVMTFGDVSLMQNEKELLDLGPGFMVVSTLNDQEMQVEASVTLTKIRWAKRKSGTEGMTEAEARAEVEPPTEEEETLADMLEDEMRDVVDSSGKDLCMGRKRPTDMVNNREVKMPGPGPPNAEAEFSTRLSSWQRAFLSFKETDCNPDGVQKRSNLSPTQLMAVKTISKKVAKVEISKLTKAANS